MSDWGARLLHEWAVIASAPMLFAIVAIGVGLIAWVVVHVGYRYLLAARKAQAAQLERRLAAYEDKLRGASPDQAATELVRLRAEVHALKHPWPRDPDAVYQRGQKIGVADGAVVNQVSRTVMFARITVAGAFDGKTQLEYRDLLLAFQRADVISSTRTGLAAKTTLQNPTFAIVGGRAGRLAH